MKATEMPAATPQTSLIVAYLDLWIKSIAERLGSVLGVSVASEPMADSGMPQGTPGEAGLWIRLFGGKAGEQAFFLTTPDALRLSRVLEGTKADPAAELTSEARESVVRFFQQIAAAIPIADWLGVECQLVTQAADELPWTEGSRAAVQFSTPQGLLLTLRARLSSDFASALQSAADREGATGMRSDRTPARPASQKPARESNLDLLMDVELDATVRFGQREMLLGEILNLAPGSVVELDQQVQDPVELLVGGKVIARGEVVAVDGNYGLRITALASREERLESLRKPH